MIRNALVAREQGRHERARVRRREVRLAAARPAPRRCSRSRARSTTRARSTSACATTRGSWRTRPPTSRASRSPCWSRTAASARRPRRRSRARCSTTTCSASRRGPGAGAASAPLPRRRGSEPMSDSMQRTCGLGTTIAGELWRVWEFVARRIDRFLFGITMAIVGVGLVTLFSAADQSVDRVRAQLASLAVALVAMWIVANIPPQTLARTAVPLYVLARRAADRRRDVRHRRQRLAALAQPRHHAHPAFRAHEDRAAADARLVLPEVRGTHRLEGLRVRRGADRRARRSSSSASPTSAPRC